MTFGERLVYYRTKMNLTQKALAELLDITPTRLNYWEKDKREPDVEMIRQLSAALGVSANILIGYEDDPEVKKAPASEEAEADEYEAILSGLTGMLHSMGWIREDGDISDADRRFLFSVAAMLNAYFEEQR